MSPMPTPIPVCPDSGMFSVLCFKASGISGVVGTLASFFIGLGVIIALFYLLWGATKWINSGGDKATLEAARSNVIAATIGLIVLLLTFLIINVLLGFFNIGLESINLENLRLKNTL